MNRNKKIEKINAYRKMLETKKLPSPSKDKQPGPVDPENPDTWTVEEQIHDEFTRWAENQLAVLMGEARPQSSLSDFTSEETMVLKSFATKMLQKASGEQAAQGSTRPAPLPVSGQGRPAQVPQSNRPTPTPMGNRGTTSVQAEKVRNRDSTVPVGQAARLKNLSLEEMDQIAGAIED